MKLRRLEFGMAGATETHIKVYARRSNGQLFLRSFPRDTPDVLAVAEAAFAADISDWRVLTPRPESGGMSLVWESGARLHVSGEASVTADALAHAGVNLLISMNRIKDRTRADLQAYAAEHPAFRHVDAPMLDVLPKDQSEEGRRNAIEALHAAESELRAGGTVAIHCIMGIHRSVSVGAVALARAGFVTTPRDGFLAIHGMRRAASWIPETVEWLETLPPRG